MALILNLETSTKNCSVSLARNGEVISLIEESSEQYIHSEKLHLFIDQALKESQAGFNDLNAVAVGKGPGSYTGLRIGVSAAKGLCYARNLPLISEDGLQILVSDFLSGNSIAEDEIVMPMLDARRMEVYCAPYQGNGKRLVDIKAEVIGEDSFRDLEASKIHLIGDGAEKCREVLTGPRFVFHQLEFPSAKAMADISYQKFQKEEFEDLAYFEPFYLKDFIAGKPKKLL